MNHYIKYISTLLSYHDLVIVPGFGAFICQMKGAYLNEKNGMIYPPKREILFNKNMIHDDGILVNKIAKEENISTYEAQTNLAILCHEFEDTLYKSKLLVLKDIGVLYLDTESNIMFQHDFNDNVTTLLANKPLKLNADDSDITEVEVEEVDFVSRIIPKKKLGKNNKKLDLCIKTCTTTVVAVAVVFAINYHLVDENTSLNGIIANQDTQEPDMFGTIAPLDDIKIKSVVSEDYDYITFDPAEDLY